MSFGSTAEKLLGHTKASNARFKLEKRAGCRGRGPGKGDETSSMGDAFRAVGPSPADLRSAASPAARARQYGRCRGRGGRGGRARA